MQFKGDICVELGQIKTGLEIHCQLRDILLAHQPLDYGRLALNYKSIAEIYRIMGELQVSSKYCNKVFQLEEQGFLESYHSAFAHSRMALIAAVRGHET